MKANVHINLLPMEYVNEFCLLYKVEWIIYEYLHVKITINIVQI